jgi:hypothetical protein
MLTMIRSSPKPRMDVASTPLPLEPPHEARARLRESVDRVDRGDEVREQGGFERLAGEGDVDLGEIEGMYDHGDSVAVAVRPL